MVSAKIIFAAVLAVVGAVAYIVAYTSDEIARVDSGVGSAWCGREAAWLCVGTDCEEQFFLGEHDSATETFSWDDLCDFCTILLDAEDCPGCQAQTAGVIWNWGLIAGIVGSGLGALFLAIPQTRGFGGGLIISGCVSGVIAIVAFYAFTSGDDGLCFNEDSDSEPGASLYVAGVGALVLLVGGIMSCGAGRYD